MNITDVVTWTNPVPLIDDGDPLSNAEFLATAQALANRTAWLKQWIADAPSIHVPLLNFTDTPTNFAKVVSSEKNYYQQTDVGGVGALYFHIPQLVTGRKITGVTAYWHNPNNTTLPVGTMPTVSLKKVIHAVGTAAPDDTTVGSQADTTAVVATYQAVHTIALTGLTETIAADAMYYVKFAGETGSNSQTGGQIWGLRVHLAP